MINTIDIININFLLKLLKYTEKLKIKLILIKSAKAKKIKLKLK